jgi:hypothetical protein
VQLHRVERRLDQRFADEQLGDAASSEMLRDTVSRDAVR